MKFNTDDHFVIGSEHISQGKPCQDHALSGLHEQIAYAVVSDGCSSGGLTDVGSRLITLSTAAAIREHLNRDESGPGSLLAPIDVNGQQRNILSGIKEILRLKSSDMLATSVYAYLSPSTGFVQVRGDGVVALVRIDGSITLIRYDWPNNTPFYPAYLDTDLALFVDAHGGDVKSAIVREEIVHYGTDGKIFSDPDLHTMHTITEGIEGITTWLSMESLAYIAVFSDGVCRVDGFNWKDTALQLMAFKSSEGVFAKRRMNAFIKNTHKVGKGPLDDIAYAVIHIKHEKGEM